MRVWTLLGLGLLVLITGCIGADIGNEEPPEAEVPEEPSFEPVTYEWSDEFIVAGMDDAHAYTFDVPEGATEVMGQLTWSMPGAVLWFDLIDPEGEVQASGWIESDQHRYVTTTHPPTPGEWTVEVTGDRGVDVHYDMLVEAREGQPYGPIQETYTIPPDETATIPNEAPMPYTHPDHFAEVNLNMEPDQWFTFEWEATDEVYFNVHWHEDDETHRPIEHTGTALDGNFTAPETQVYSPIWVNTGDEPVDVHVEIDGEYRLHSMTRDQPPR